MHAPPPSFRPPLLCCSQPSGDTELVASMEQALPLQVLPLSPPLLRLPLRRLLL